MEQKTNPYLRPLYDILWAVLEAAGKSNAASPPAEIEIVPLAFMRGLTFNDAILILDEAQNTTPGQMKMLLSRLLGNNAQNHRHRRHRPERPATRRSSPACRMRSPACRASANIAFHTLDQEDIVRHPLVCDILSAYEKVLSYRCRFSTRPRRSLRRAGRCGPGCGRPSPDWRSWRTSAFVSSIARGQPASQSPLPRQELRDECAVLRLWRAIPVHGRHRHLLPDCPR